MVLSSKKYILKPSNKKEKKLMIITPSGRTIHFGSKGCGDFIKYSKRDYDLADMKKESYIKRHSKLNENWSEKGLETAGFWARWILWNKRTLQSSIDDVNKRFNIIIN